MFWADRWQQRRGPDGPVCALGSGNTWVKASKWPVAHPGTHMIELSRDLMHKSWYIYIQSLKMTAAFYEKHLFSFPNETDEEAGAGMIAV